MIAGHADRNAAANFATAEVVKKAAPNFSVRALPNHALPCLRRLGEEA